MKTVCIDRSFYDFDKECGLGEIDIDVTLVCDCDESGSGKAELKEVLFRRISDKFGSLIYPGEVETRVWSVLHDYVADRCREQWATLELFALASDPTSYPILAR
jgi:hypothetical protein